MGITWKSYIGSDMEIYYYMLCGLDGSNPSWKDTSSKGILYPMCRSCDLGRTLKY